jgi:arabinofuranan 3-O-arabinosyltransferase
MRDPRIADSGSGNKTTGRVAARVFDITATIIFWIAVCALIIHLFLKLYPLTEPKSTADALVVDFAVFWAASKLALAGQPLAAFDHQTLLAAARLPSANFPVNFLWLYPASFLVVMMPFGLLSFPQAFFAFITSSVAAFALTVRSPASVLPGLWRLMLASPVMITSVVLNGQSSVLWVTGLVAALWAMRGGNAVAAGFAIALLTMKPQLGLLIPVTLIAARQWATIGWATGFTLLLTAAATALTDPGYWVLFFDALNTTVDRLADGTLAFHRMASFYGFMRALGVAHEAAINSQFALTAGLIAIIGWVWSRPHLNYDLKCATLCAAIPLATPYAFYYEMAIVLAVALFLIRDGFGQRLSAKAWLLVLWVGPAPALLFPTQLSVALYAPPILLVTLAICLVRARCRLSTNGPDNCDPARVAMI